MNTLKTTFIYNCRKSLFLEKVITAAHSQSLCSEVGVLVLASGSGFGLSDRRALGVARPGPDGLGMAIPANE